MAIELANRVDDLKAQVNAPGAEAFPNESEEAWILRLINGFWEARLDGLLTNFDADEDGVVTPISGTEDMSRELQQIVVIYAAFIAIRNQIAQARTVFRVQAGPTEFETQNSATVYKVILDDLRARRDMLLKRLVDTGQTSTAVLDAVVWRTDAIYNSLTHFWT